MYELEKGLSAFEMLNHARQELNPLVWLQHGDARFAQLFIKRTMIPERRPYELSISRKR
jgi:hypothetical protein